MLKIGIIGGSGLGDKLNLTQIQRIKSHTPYGAPSDLIISGQLNGVPVVALPRHGSQHTIMPSLVPYRANIWAFKQLGVSHIIAVTACGSLREEIHPGELVFIDQFIDRTTRRSQTFFEGQAVEHIPMAEPFCPSLRKLFKEIAGELKLAHHPQGTMVTIEGPRFSTKAESRMFQLWGGDVINMSSVPEVVLAREAGICYAAIAMCTDFDCWHASAAAVNFEMIVKTMQANAANVNRMLAEIVGRVPPHQCSCGAGYKITLC